MDETVEEWFRREILPHDVRHLLIRTKDQLYLVRLPDEPGIHRIDLNPPHGSNLKLTDTGADFFGWSAAGSELYWAVGSTIHRRSSVERASPTTRKLEIHATFPRSKPRTTTLLRHATLLTMENDHIVANADLLIRNDRIDRIAPGGSIEVLRDTHVLEGSGKYVIPGLISTHTHWGEHAPGGGVLQPEGCAFTAMLAYGVTSTLDPQSSTVDLITYGDLAETGQLIGPRIFTTGPGVTLGAYMLPTYRDSLFHLKRYKDHYGLNNVKIYEPGDRLHRQWMLMASRALELNATAHPGITGVMDGFHGHEHVLQNYPLYRDVVEVFRHTRTVYDMTLSGFHMGFLVSEFLPGHESKLERFLPRSALAELATRQPAQPDEAESLSLKAQSGANIQLGGGLLSVGAENGVWGLGVHFEMWAMGLSMSARQVLRAATIDGARMIGVAQDLGSIAEGKLADLVILDKNPLQNIRNSASIRYVIKNGEVLDIDALQCKSP